MRGGGLGRHRERQSSSRKAHTQCFGVCVCNTGPLQGFLHNDSESPPVSLRIPSGLTTVNSWYTSFPIFCTNIFLKKKKRRDHTVHIILQAASPLTVWQASSRASTESSDCSFSSGVGFQLAHPGPLCCTLELFPLAGYYIHIILQTVRCPCPVLS